VQPGVAPASVTIRVPSPKVLAAYVTVLSTLTSGAWLAGILYGKVHAGAGQIAFGAAGIAIVLSLYPWLLWQALMRRNRRPHSLALAAMLLVCVALVVVLGQAWAMALAAPAALFGVVWTSRAGFAVAAALVLSLATVTYGLIMEWPFLPALFAGGYMLAAAFSGTMAVWFCHVVEELRQARAELAGRAVGEERLRFARDLHDVLGHSLQAVALRAELAERMIDRDPGRVAKELVEIQSIARGAVKDVREVVRGYRTTSLRTELEGATAVLHAAGIRCQAPLIPPDLPAAVHETFGWVARESVTNMLRHAAATWCLLTVWADNGRVHLEIVNDGASRLLAGTPGSGLAGLTERVEKAGGTFTAGPVGDGTFRVAAELAVEGVR
jgi:two-component system, NarL family, sensor histidine kinase DesK